MALDLLLRGLYYPAEYFVRFGLVLHSTRNLSQSTEGGIAIKVKVRSSGCACHLGEFTEIVEKKDSLAIYLST